MQAIVKKQFVQVEGAEVGAAPRPNAAAQRCKKNVRLLRVEAVVHAIEVTCSCGESTVVELEYAPHKD
jgi:hypothetical protein